MSFSGSIIQYTNMCNTVELFNCFLAKYSEVVLELRELKRKEKRRTKKLKIKKLRRCHDNSQ